MGGEAACPGGHGGQVKMSRECWRVEGAVSLEALQDRESPGELSSGGQGSLKLKKLLRSPFSVTLRGLVLDPGFM